MKFLCVPCDSPMKLSETKGPDEGSMSLVYSCPECAYEFAMVTNPFETQIVGSLGVKVGPREGAAAAAAAGESTASGESKCPFSAMVSGAGGDAATRPDQPRVEEAIPAMTDAPSGTEGVPWTAGAEQRMATVPEFVRPMARAGIERFATEKGYKQVDERVLDEAREFFGM